MFKNFFFGKRIPSSLAPVPSFINHSAFRRGMFNIPPVENHQFFIDQGVKKMQEAASKEREKIEERFRKNVSTQRKTREEIKLNKRKDLELAKVKFLNDFLNNRIRKTVKRFPDLRHTEDIYRHLIDTSEVPVSELQSSLSRLIWIADSVDELSQRTEHKIKKAKTDQTIGFVMNKHLGKVNSLFRRNQECFRKLEQGRRFMNQLPTFEYLFTVAIAGFPNVGKSTLMRSMTGSKIEIQNYPFTTKGLLFSFLFANEQKCIQLIDTPGLLGRKQNNSIEERANIVLTEYADAIVFVFDVTESCGYSLDQQIKLCKQIQKQDTPLCLYFSKEDIFNEEDQERKQDVLKQFRKLSEFSQQETLQEELFRLRRESAKPSFDPSKVKVIK